jgi:hypothetical protein
MNLNAIVAPLVAAVNPLTRVSVRISVGQQTQPNGERIPAYATPGAITASIAGTVLTVTAIASGVLQAGQALAGALPLVDGTAIVAQLTGTPGGLGTYRLNREQTVPSQAMTTALELLAQIQPMGWRDLQLTEGLNLGGERRTMYANADINGVLRVELKGGDLVTLPSGQVWLVAQQLEGWSETAGWSKTAITLQNGS